MSEAEVPFLPFHPPVWWLDWVSDLSPLLASVVRDEPPPMTDPDWWRRPEQLGPPPGWVE